MYKQRTFIYNSCMEILQPDERPTLQAIANLAYCNPFLADRTNYEKQALGPAYISAGPVWSASVTAPHAHSPNVVKMHQRLETLLPQIRARLADPALTPSPADLTTYIDCVQYLLFQRYDLNFLQTTRDWSFYRQFETDWRHFFNVIPNYPAVTLPDPAHVFACFRQLRRAFQHIFDNIIGNSMPIARLRASAWQSVFTHDLRRYHRVLYSRMHDFPTLITGPSGTGKELIARAIAGARFVPFHPRTLQFEDPLTETFLPINLAALSPALIESELFGHKKGSFTGALADRKGWLETCPPTGCVFLDELGEMDLSIQVKLLRVIETRKFSMVGDTAPREFPGKLIAATNRDLSEAIRTGRFREDLYYRLCADLIRTPSLRDQLDDSPAVLDDLILFMVRRTVGDDAERCFPEVQAWIAENIPQDYAWPGNYRELEQCVRNVIIRRSYRPLTHTSDTADPMSERIAAGQISVDELVSWYAALVYRKAGTYEEASKILGIDRRTVKAKVEAFLERSTG